MDRIDDLSTYQHILLIIMVGMVLVFSVIYAKEGAFKNNFEDEYGEDSAYDSGVVISYVNDEGEEETEIIYSNNNVGDDESYAGPKSKNWFFGVFICIMNALSILFAEELFHWDMKFRIRNADQAEASDVQIISRYIGWTGVTIMALYFFAMGL